MRTLHVPEKSGPYSSLKKVKEVDQYAFRVPAATDIVLQYLTYFIFERLQCFALNYKEY